jgi:hypothetical protein
MQHEIVSREAWLAARTALLDAEKKLAQTRAVVVDQRRTLPWTRVDKAYEFDTPAASTIPTRWDRNARGAASAALLGLEGSLILGGKAVQ